MYSFLRGQEEIDHLSRSPAFPPRSKNSQTQSTASTHSTDEESLDGTASLVQFSQAGTDHDVKDNRVRVNIQSSQNTLIDMDERATVNKSHPTVET